MFPSDELNDTIPYKTFLFAIVWFKLLFMLSKTVQSIQQVEYIESKCMKSTFENQKVMAVQD